VQVETNLLRFPFFALHTKGLRNIDFKEVKGTRTEGGRTEEFLFRVSRNTDHLYPGPLSRKAHFALLSLLRKQGFPFRNPIAFTWRQLAREMGVAYSGSKCVSRLKDALHSTLGTMIKSSYALKEGESRTSLPSRERGYALYVECLFTNDVLPDGTISDRNFVSLADWYLANLNSLYAAPIDYVVWNRLNDHSPLASRLYEFLLFNFSAGIETFTINYAKLCQFLPAKVEPYASQAKEQLGSAMRLLLEEEIVGNVEWGTAKNGELQLRILRGDCLLRSDSRSLMPTMPADLFESVTTQDGTSDKSPAERLVSQFHEAWSGGQGSRPSSGELDAAKNILDQYGFDLAARLLVRVLKRMRDQFPDAKTFGATRQYFAEVHTEHLKRERIAESAKTVALKEAIEDESQKQSDSRRAELESIWQALPKIDRKSIEKSVIVRNPNLKLSKFPKILLRLCLDELSREKSAEMGLDDGTQDLRKTRWQSQCIPDSEEDAYSV
jgi:hypothetical protein